MPRKSKPDRIKVIVYDDGGDVTYSRRYYYQHQQGSLLNENKQMLQSYRSIDEALDHIARVYQELWQTRPIRVKLNGRVVRHRNVKGN